MGRLTPDSIRASQVELPPIGTLILELRRQDPSIQQEQHRYRSPRGYQAWTNHLAYAALIEAGAEVMNELADPIGFWAATTCRWARIVDALPRGRHTMPLLLGAQSAPPGGPTGAVGTGIRCCTGKNARCGGCNGFSRSMWGSVESADSQKMTAALLNSVPPSDIVPSIYSATRPLLRTRADLPEKVLVELFSSQGILAQITNHVVSANIKPLQKQIKSAPSWPLPQVSAPKQ